MDRFPLPPEASYRYQQNFSMDHLGIDIMATQGTPVLAVEDGTAWATRETKGGNVVYLDGAKTGNRYFYGHLWQWTPNLVISDNPKVAVKSGEQLGYVGSTGNAAGKPPHVHFQMRRGSLVIDPYPELQKVDPDPSRGSSGPTVHRRRRRTIEMPSIEWPSSIAPGIALCIALYLVARRW